MEMCIVHVHVYLLQKGTQTVTISFEYFPDFKKKKLDIQMILQLSGCLSDSESFCKNYSVYMNIFFLSLDPSLRMELACYRLVVGNQYALYLTGHFRSHATLELTLHPARVI